MAKISTTIIMGFFGLKTNKNKEYSEEESRTNEVYVFNSREDFYDYFLENNVNIYDKELLDLAIFAEMKNGEVIAIKGLCDHIIKQELFRNRYYFPTHIASQKRIIKAMR